MSSIFDNKSITLDLKVNEYKEIEVHQLDNATITLNLVNYNEPIELADYTIEFRCAKPDGTYVIQTTGMSKSAGGVITINLLQSVISLSGRVVCELKLTNYSSNLQISTYNFILLVRPNVLEGCENGDGIYYTKLGILNERLEEFSSTKDAVDALVTSGTNVNNLLKENISSATTLESELVSNVLSGTNVNNLLKENISSATSLNNTVAQGITALQNEVNTATNVTNNLSNVNNTSNNTISQMNNLLSNIANLSPVFDIYNLNLNIMTMLLYDEKISNTRVSGYRDMYIDSLIDDSKLTLDSVAFDSDNHKITVCNGDISSISYCYLLNNSLVYSGGTP